MCSAGQILPVEELERYKKDTILDLVQFLEMDEPPKDQLDRALDIPNLQTLRAQEPAAFPA